MSKADPLVYVLVLNFCSADDTLGCVESFRLAGYSNARLLVLDNASPDGSGQKLRSQLPEYEFVQLSTNIGYAGGNNVGNHIALKNGADYVFIVNPDVRLPVGSLQQYVNIMESDPSISAINPIQLMEGGKGFDSLFEWEMFTSNGHEVPSLPLQAGQQWNVKTLFGAALFLRGKTLENVGNFDPLFFAYWEEIDLCRRIKLHGGSLIVVSDSPVVHLRSYKNKGVDPFRAYLRLKGMYYYRLKDNSRSFAPLVRELTYEIFYNILKPEENDFFWGRKEYFKTLIWVLRHLPSIYLNRKRDLRGKSYI